MDVVRLANYLAGLDPGPIEAWRLDIKIARILRVKPGTIAWLSAYTLTKTRYRHPEINYSDFQMIPEILALGFATPGNKERSVDLCHLDTTEAAKFKLWRVCLKATHTDEVFISMFHRSNLKEARRLYRRAKKRNALLRDHKREMARRLLRHASGA